MKTIKILGDTLNKVTDTSAVFKFRLWNDGLAQDVTSKAVSVTVANASGYLFDVTPKNNGTEVELDFSDAKLKELTPDTYKLEINVTNANGDVEVYPSNGAVEFLVTRNLKSQTGTLVPQVTFDAVLEGVDKKIADYIASGKAKGPKGDTGPQGPKGDKGDTGAQGPKGDKGDKGDPGEISGSIGGRNLLLGTADWKSPNFDGRGTLTSAKFGGMTIAETGGAWSSPRYSLLSLVNQGYIKTGTPYVFSTYVRNTSDNTIKVAPYGNNTIMDGTGTTQTLPAKSDWTQVYTVFNFKEIPSASNSTGNNAWIRWETGDALVNGKLQFAGYKLEIGATATDWTPAPEDTVATANSLTTRVATFTDFADVAKNMTAYSGNWQITASVGIANGPYGTTSRGTYVSVQNANWPDAGSIMFYDLTGPKDVYVGMVSGGGITWSKVAKDSNVVHTAGNETIAGDKSLTGNTNLSNTTILAGSYGLRVTSSGFQKTTNGGSTWVNATL